MHEKAALALDDEFGHAQDGVKALLHVAHEPARFLQALAQFGVFAAAQGAGVGVVHAQARDEVAVELHVKFLRGAAAAGSDDDVGDDDFALDIGKAPAGFGFKPGDDGLGGVQLVFADAQLRGQAARVAAGQQLQRAVAGAEFQRVFDGRPPGIARV